MQLGGYTSAYKQRVCGCYLCCWRCVHSEQRLAGMIYSARPCDLKPVDPAVHCRHCTHYDQLRCLRALVKSTVTEAGPSCPLVHLPYRGLPCTGVKHLREEGCS